MADLTQELLKSLLRYEPETGKFYWVVGSTRRRPGDRAGSVRPTDHANAGRVEIKVRQKSYLAHRLAYLYMAGSWPDDEIDHIDGNQWNNRWANLRQATGSENCQNLWKAKKGKTGVLGVYRKVNKFYAQITTAGVSRFLGSFNSKDEAHAAYLRAKRVLHPFGEIAKENS